MEFIEEWVGSSGWADAVTVGLYAVAALAAYVVMRLLLPLLQRGARRSRFLWDDVFESRKLRHRLALLAPAIVFYVGAANLADQDDTWQEFLVRVSLAVLVLIATFAFSALLEAGNAVYETRPVSQRRPLEAYTQIVRIVVFLFAIVVVVAVLAGQSPWLFLSGLGAVTAVLLLIFKDTLLSLVASLQLSLNNMVRVGDWIEMPEFDADGDVIDVELHTVTVQNWDKTISTIPTYALINRPFRNWRGMSDTGRRRIKRALYIDMSSVRFLTDEEIERFGRFQPLQEYMAGKLAELDDDRSSSQPQDEDVIGDPRRLTNLGTLRAYIVHYLRALDTVDTETMTFLIRHLQPGRHGLPLEIYVFAATTEWARYEAIQADIFDHIIAMVPEFGLRVFQDPTGEDLRIQTAQLYAGDGDRRAGSRSLTREVP